jgi:hypothetical protein
MENSYQTEFSHQSEKRWRRVRFSFLFHERGTQLQSLANRAAILQPVIAEDASPLMDLKRDIAARSVTRRQPPGVVDGARKINQFSSEEATKDSRRRSGEHFRGFQY